MGAAAAAIPESETDDAASGTSDVLSLVGGWNFVSVPMYLSQGNNTALQVFGGIDMASHSILQYNASIGRWNQLHADSRVLPRAGCWVYSTHPVQILLHPDTTPALPPSKTLYPGWNSIGFVDLTPVNAKNALLTIQNSWNKLVGWDATLQRYDSAIYNTYPSYNQQVVPMKGYWLYLKSSGLLS